MTAVEEPPAAEQQSKKRLKRNAEVIEEETKETPKSQTPVKAAKAPVVVSTLPLKKPDDIALPSSADFDPIKDSPHHTGQ